MAIGTTEIIIVLIIILILFGPKKLPELARAIGRSVHEFKKASHGAEAKSGKKKKLQG